MWNTIQNLDALALIVYEIYDHVFWYMSILSIIYDHMSTIYDHIPKLDSPYVLNFTDFMSSCTKIFKVQTLLVTDIFT